MLTPDSSANGSQIVRYSIQLPDMQQPENIVAVRAILMDHHLLVDRISAGEAIVAAADGTAPEWENIKADLQDAGFPATHTTTADE